jgi:hypothetical protein
MDDKPEDMDDKPENIFAGHEWEYKIDNDGDYGNINKIIISFTKNEFTFYHRIDRTHEENTFTGTYSLFYEKFDRPPFDPVFEERIKFISDIPTLNGVADYSVQSSNLPFGEEVPIGSILFTTRSGDCTSLDQRLFIPVKN